jgi:sn-glycerol 3-phosphate transport system substrate-binding protein
MIARRDVLQAVGGWLALGAAGCAQRRRPIRENGRVVVTFWYAYGDLVRKVLLELVGRFNATQTRVLVRAVHQGDYFEALAKLRTAVAAGAAPTLSHVICEVVPYLARAGVLEPLDDYEGARALPFVTALDQRGAFAGGDGEPIVAIPFNRSTPIAFANARILEDEHVDVPRTWEELVDVARRLTRRASDGQIRWGFEVPISWWYWVAMLGQAGGRLVEADGRLSLGGEAGEKAVRFWQRLVQKEHVMRPPPGRDYQAWQSSNESFLQGRIAMMWSSTAFVRYLENNARFPVLAAPMPRDVRASVPTGGTMFVVMRSAPEEEKQAAWEFVRWMCDAEQTIAWSTRTGYMPVTQPAVARLVERGWYVQHPNDRVAYDQLSDVDPWPWAPELFRIERDIVEPRLEEAVLTGRDAHALMDEARKEAGRPARGPASVGIPGRCSGRRSRSWWSFSSYRSGWRST